MPAVDPPLDEVIGMPADAAVPLYEAQGMTVQIIDLNVSSEVTQERNIMRVRLYVRDGVIERATQS